MYRALVGLTLVLAFHASPTIAVETVLTNTEPAVQDVSVTVDQDTTTTQTTLLLETFDGPDSDTVGNGWLELEVDKGTVARSGNRLVFSTQDTKNRPIVSRTFPRVTADTVVWEFEFDWARTGRDYNYRLFMQLGDGVQMREDYWDAGVAVNLMWSSVGSHEQLGYRTGGGVTELAQISGPTKLQVLVNTSQATYDVLIDGVPVATALPFDQATAFDTVRFFTDSVKAPHFSGMAFDTVKITTDGSAPGNSAPSAQAQTVALDPDTTANVTLGYTDTDGPGPYTFTVVQGPTNGTLGSNDGDAAVTYTPAVGYSGTDSFTFRVNDSLDDSSTATVSLSVGTQTTLLMETFDGPDSDTVGNGWVELEVDKGTVALSGNRLVFSTQDTKNRPIVSRTFPRVTSGAVVWEFEFDWARTGRDYNYRLFMQLGDGVQMREDYWDAGVAVNLMWSSVGSHEQLGYRTEGGVTGLTQISGPTKLQVLVNASQGTYDVLIDGVLVGAALPFDQATGFDTVRFFTDSVKAPHFSGMAFDTVAITTAGGAPANTIPAAQAQSVTLDQDTTANVTLGYTDADDGPGPYTFTVVQGPTNGTLGSDDGDAAVSYSPNDGYSGPDSFTFRVNDGLDDSDTATVNFTVEAVVTNTAPTAQSQSVTLNQDTTANVTLGYTDADGPGPYTFTIDQGPANGTLGSNDGDASVTYTPAAGYSGPDSFTFRVNDGLDDSDTATVNFTVEAVAINTAPTAEDQNVILDQDTTANVTLGVTDPDGPGPYTFTIVQGPANGTLEQAPADDIFGGDFGDALVTYTPTSGYSGPDSFTFRVNDGLDDSATATVSIAVEATNTAPVAQSQSVTLDQDTTANVTLSYTDADGPGPYTFTVVQGPANGTLGSNDGDASLTYTPASGYSGPDSFTFRVNDGLDDSATATISFTVEATNTAPVAQSQSVTLDQDTTANVVLGYTDADGPGPYTYTIIQSPTNGVIGSNDGDASVTYTPASGYSGPDSLTFRVNDGLDNSTTATVSLTVKAVNTAPTAQAQSVTLDQDTTANVTLAYTDADGPGPYSFTIVQGPANGTLGSDDGHELVTYTPAAGYSGPDSFTFRVNDGLDDSTDAVVSVTVASATGGDITSNLINHWLLDDGAGATALDSAGSNSGTLNGPLWVPGQSGQALSFNGIDDFVHLGSFDVSGSALTIAAWIKADSFQTNDARIVSKAVGSAEQDHHFMLSTIANDGIKLRFRLKTGSITSTLIASSGTLATGQWIHVAAVYNGSAMILYKDGVEVGRLAKTGALATNASVPVAIGRNPLGYGTFDGSIDDVRVYQRALAPSDIGTLVNPTSPPVDTTPPTVSITAPSAGSSVSGTVTVSADAADAGGVAGVQFRLDSTNLGAEDLTAPYSVNWNTATASAGSYILSAVARDAAGNLATSATVSLTVVEGMNNAPTISGTPPDEARIGQEYTFTPTAFDPDGDSLTFSVSNKPSWSSINTNTGTLFGTPAAGDEGIYDNISITVSDGSASASTLQFSITVQQASMGSATLSWTAPTQNTDGTPLTNLSAFKIYYGTADGNYPNEIIIDNPGISTYVVEDLPPDTYYFVSTAINSNGVESEYSNMANKVVD